MRKYSSASVLFDDIEAYFNSISAVEEVTAPAFDGYDEKGKARYKPEPMLNKLGKPLVRTVWITPPTVGGLCLALDISRKTFSEYGKRSGGYGEAVEYARSVILAYLEEARNDPETRNVKGVDLGMQSIERALESDSSARVKKLSRADYEAAARRALESGFLNELLVKKNDGEGEDEHEDEDEDE